MPCPPPLGLVQALRGLFEPQPCPAAAVCSALLAHSSPRTSSRQATERPGFGIAFPGNEAIQRDMRLLGTAWTLNREGFASCGCVMLVWGAVFTESTTASSSEPTELCNAWQEAAPRNRWRRQAQDICGWKRPAQKPHPARCKKSAQSLPASLANGWHSGMPRNSQQHPSLNDRVRLLVFVAGGNVHGLFTPLQERAWHDFQANQQNLKLAKVRHLQIAKPMLGQAFRRLGMKRAESGWTFQATP